MIATASIFKKQELVDIQTKNIVSGYIRNVQLLLPKDNYYNIPKLINHIIIFYLYDCITFDIDKAKHTSSLEFSNDNKTVSSKQCLWSICIIDLLLTKEICKQFIIEYKVNMVILN